MLKFSTYIYLMVLAIADTFVLHVGLLRLWVGELTGYDLRDQYNWLCKATNVVGNTVSDFSVWLIIAVTIERYIVVCHPLKASSICNTPRARKFILGLFLSFLALNLHFIWTVEIRYYAYESEKIPRCSGAKNHTVLIDDIWPWVDAALYSFVPFATVSIINILIIRQVMRAHRRRNTMQLMGNRTNVSNNTGEHYEHRRSHEGSSKLTIMLLTISFSFLFTTLPMMIVNIIVAFWNRENPSLHVAATFTLARTITELLMYTNHSMNFFLYCATGQKFRQQLIWLLCYSKRRKYAQQHRAHLQHKVHLQQTSTWQSELSQATRMETTRMEPMRLAVGNERSPKLSIHHGKSSDPLSATIKSEMYTPLKHSTSA